MTKCPESDYDSGAYLDDIPPNTPKGSALGDANTVFMIKDSGEREKFDSGMVRDIEDDKVDYTFILKGPMLRRWAEHLMGGAKKYARDNWMQANSLKELERFERSALRHMVQWLDGERDEDHAAAIIFNVNGAEYVRDNLLGS